MKTSARNLREATRVLTDTDTPSKSELADVLNALSEYYGEMTDSRVDIHVDVYLFDEEDFVIPAGSLMQ